jgi:transposase
VGTYFDPIDQPEERSDVEEKDARTQVPVDHRLRWLVAIPGLGPRSAAPVLAEVGNVRRLPSKRQFWS